MNRALVSDLQRQYARLSEHLENILFRPREEEVRGIARCKIREREKKMKISKVDALNLRGVYTTIGAIGA